MAKKKHNEVVVGITVLAVLLLTFYIMVMLADWRGLTTPKQTITVRLPYTMGLRGLMPGSPVNLGGTKIGQVVDTRIEKLKPGTTNVDDIFVFFTISIPKVYPLRQDCLLEPESNVLGGKTVLNILDLGSDGAVVKDGETIEVVLGDSFTEVIKKEFDVDNPDSLIARLKYEVNRDKKDSVLASVIQSAENLKQITAKIDQQVTVDQQKYKDTLMTRVLSITDNLNAITERINVQLDTENKEAVMVKVQMALDKLDDSLVHIKELVETNKPGVTKIVSSLEKTAEQLEKDLPEITGKIKQSLTKAEQAIDTAQATLQNLKDFTAQTKELITVNRDNINQLINNVTEVSVNMKLASREIRRAPWKLLYKPKKGELKIQGLIDSAGSFAAGAESLDNATLRLRTVLAGTDDEIKVGKEKIDAIIADLEAGFEQYKKAEKKFWEEMQ